MSQAGAERKEVTFCQRDRVKKMVSLVISGVQKASVTQVRAENLKQIGKGEPSKRILKGGDAYGVR